MNSIEKIDKKLRVEFYIFLLFCQSRTTCQNLKYIPKRFFRDISVDRIVFLLIGKERKNATHGPCRKISLFNKNMFRSFENFCILVLMVIR